MNSVELHDMCPLDGRICGPSGPSMKAETSRHIPHSTLAALASASFPHPYLLCEYVQEHELSCFGMVVLTHRSHVNFRRRPGVPWPALRPERGVAMYRLER